MTKQRDILLEIAVKIGTRPDYVQGGGGNLSLKINDVLMLIKASGLRFDELTAEYGLVGVAYPAIKNFYETAAFGEDIDALTAASVATVSTHTLKDIKAVSLRPSMEVGFHTYGAGCVIHTHSVYANILNCSFKGSAIIKELFPDTLYIPYITPGAPLTIAIRDALADKIPDIIFLENHGLIVSEETPEAAFALHENVHTRIRDRLGLHNPYPLISLSGSETTWQSDSPYAQKFIKKNPALVRHFMDTLLFPDQAIYGTNVQFDKKDAPITINIESGTITYKMKRSGAEAFEEIFVAWAFIVEEVERLDLRLKTLPQETAHHLQNLESEQYRKELAT